MKKICMNEKKKNIFFVTTVGSIYEQALPLIEQKKNDGEIIVVATTEQIELFFKDYTNFKVLRMRVHPDLINKKIWYKLFSNIIRSKIEFRSLFKDIEGSDVFFFGSGWAIVVYSYIQKLARKNTIHQILCKPTSLECNVEKTFKANLMRLFAKIFFNLDTIVVNDSVCSAYVMDAAFFEKNHVQITDDYQADYSALDKYMKKLEITKDKSILIFTEDLVVSNRIEETEFTEKLNDIVKVLNDTYPDSYVVKPHPRLNRLYGKIAESTVIPYYIPAEFVMKHNWEIAIGIESNSLISASRQTDAKVISLIDLFMYRNRESKKKWKRWLQTETHNKILFPKDLKELKKMLKKDRSFRLDKELGLDR